MIAATVIATPLARYVDGYPIYSVRLPGASPTGGFLSDEAQILSFT